MVSQWVSIGERGLPDWCLAKSFCLAVEISGGDGWPQINSQAIPVRLNNSGSWGNSWGSTSFNTSSSRSVVRGVLISGLVTAFGCQKSILFHRPVRRPSVTIADSRRFFISFIFCFRQMKIF